MINIKNKLTQSNCWRTYKRMNKQVPDKPKPTIQKEMTETNQKQTSHTYKSGPMDPQTCVFIFCTLIQYHHSPQESARRGGKIREPMHPHSKSHPFTHMWPHTARSPPCHTQILLSTPTYTSQYNWTKANLALNGQFLLALQSTDPPTSPRVMGTPLKMIFWRRGNTMLSSIPLLQNPSVSNVNLKSVDRKMCYSTGRRAAFKPHPPSVNPHHACPQFLCVQIPERLFLVNLFFF